jgi:N-acetyl-gamma-glutamyl-phosphate reductase
MKTGVIGASGYSGGELLRLLSRHPEFELSYIAAGSQAGSSVISVHPQLFDLGDVAFQATEVSLMNDCQILFFALPHGESSKLISQVKDSVKIVDLGADYRLSSADSWHEYYGGTHAGTWIYGLPEIPGQSAKISAASRVANPGCYATAIALAAAPAISYGCIDPTDIVVVASSGTTGAGRKAAINLSASEVMGSLSSYKFGGVHQHTPEIEETLGLLTKGKVIVSFTPVLAPMSRGILATTTAKLKTQISSSEVHDLYSKFYSGSPFVTVLPLGAMPATSAVIGSNSVSIQVAIDTHSQRLVVSSAIDNLGKGAASQAIQNANLMCGFEETTGISVTGLGA